MYLYICIRAEAVIAAANLTADILHFSSLSGVSHSIVIIAELISEYQRRFHGQHFLSFSGADLRYSTFRIDTKSTVK